MPSSSDQQSIATDQPFVVCAGDAAESVNKFAHKLAEKLNGKSVSRSESTSAADNNANIERATRGTNRPILLITVTIETFLDPQTCIAIIEAHPPRFVKDLKDNLSKKKLTLKNSRHDKKPHQVSKEKPEKEQFPSVSFAISNGIIEDETVIGSLAEAVKDARDSYAGHVKKHKRIFWVKNRFRNSWNCISRHIPLTAFLTLLTLLFGVLGWIDTHHEPVYTLTPRYTTDFFDGQSAATTLIASSWTTGASLSVDGYRCQLTARMANDVPVPSSLITPLPDSACTFTILDASRVLESAGKSLTWPLRLKLSMAVWDEHGRKSVVPNDEVIFHDFLEPNPVLSPGSGVTAGGSLSVNLKPPPDKQVTYEECAWSPEDRFDSDQCTAAFKAPDTLEGNATKRMEISARVTIKDGDREFHVNSQVAYATIIPVPAQTVSQTEPVTPIKPALTVVPKREPTDLAASNASNARLSNLLKASSEWQRSGIAAGDAVESALAALTPDDRSRFDDEHKLAYEVLSRANIMIEGSKLGLTAATKSDLGIFVSSPYADELDIALDRAVRGELRNFGFHIAPNQKDAAILASVAIQGIDEPTADVSGAELRWSTTAHVDLGVTWAAGGTPLFSQHFDVPGVSQTRDAAKAQALLGVSRAIADRFGSATQKQAARK